FPYTTLFRSARAGRGRGHRRGVPEARGRRADPAQPVAARTGPGRPRRRVVAGLAGGGVRAVAGARRTGGAVCTAPVGGGRRRPAGGGGPAHRSARRVCLNPQARLTV